MDNIKYSLPLGTKLKSQYEYTITQVIGQGGFGITYIATADLKVGNIVATARFAIKEFFLNGKCKRAADGVTLVPLDDPFEAEIKESLKDFITEGERINKLCRADDHIVNVNEVFTSNNTAYFVMEYINGGNLVNLMRQKGMLDAEEAKEIIIPIAKAIGKLHEERVLHLDIKPENIMMKTTEEGKLFPVIIDFGISMHFNKQGKATTRSKNGAVSDGFSPVEQYGHVNSFAPQVDVYALGATMFYMLTGKTPQQAFDVTTDYLEQSLNGTDEVVKAAVMHAMAKDSASRTESVEVFIEELNSSTKPGKQPPVSGPKPQPPTSDPGSKPSGGTVKLKEETLSDKMSSFFKDHAKTILGVALVFLVAMVLTVLVNQGFFSNPTGKEDEPAEVAITADSLDTTPSGPSVINVEDRLIQVPNGSKYNYTGELVDTLGSLPNGEGTAKFESGDKYVGTFKEGHFDEGKYYLVSDKCYFEGTFKNDEPYNGTWYNDDGTFSAYVVNGEEKL